jgi:hypothetical protein
VGQDTAQEDRGNHRQVHLRILGLAFILMSGCSLVCFLSALGVLLQNVSEWLA